MGLCVTPESYVFFYPRQMPLKVDPSPHNFNSLSGAGANLGGLACKISVLRQKFVISATRAGTILSVLACKISVLRHKLVIIYAIRAGVILGV